MRITAVGASWLRATIPADQTHVSDFGRNDSFNTCLVEIETDAGLTGLGITLDPDFVRRTHVPV